MVYLLKYSLNHNIQLYLKSTAKLLVYMLFVVCVKKLPLVDAKEVDKISLTISVPTSEGSMCCLMYRTIL